MGFGNIGDPDVLEFDFDSFLQDSGDNLEFSDASMAFAGAFDSGETIAGDP